MLPQESPSQVPLFKPTRWVPNLVVLPPESPSQVPLLNPTRWVPNLVVLPPESPSQVPLLKPTRWVPNLVVLPPESPSQVPLLKPTRWVPNLVVLSTEPSTQVSLLKPTREFWLFSLSYKEHKLIAYKSLIIWLAGRVLNKLCQPLTGNDKTGYTILYRAKNELYRKQATIHKEI